MARGDHLVVKHGTYTHHGIDMGAGCVIHYGRGLHNKVNARVEIVSREEFAGDSPIEIRSDQASFSMDEVVDRAVSRLGENNYDLFENNCEHFVNWCRRGVADSPQINLVDSACRRGSAAAAKIAFPGLTAKATARVARQMPMGRFVAKSATRGGLAASLAGDLVQISAEVVAIRSGKDRAQSRQIGQRTGALAASGVGYMLGGPAGAAIGFGSWLVGEVVGQKASATTRRVIGK